jgi:hypothetical protein
LEALTTAGTTRIRLRLMFRYAPDSGAKARIINGLVHRNKIRAYSITLSARASRDGGMAPSYCFGGGGGEGGNAENRAATP